jgi:hypothetical protein
MSCSCAKGPWEVRWRDTTGRQRSKRFKDELAAPAFDGAIRDHATGNATREDTTKRAASTRTRWRPGRGGVYVVRRWDGSMTSKRGSPAKRPPATRGGAVSSRWSAARSSTTQRCSISIGLAGLSAAGLTWSLGRGAYDRDGRLRLVPALGDVPLGQLDVERIGSLCR